METQTVSPEKKDSIIKTLAIAGFIGVIIILAWLAIQLVHLVPNAVTSLASLAEGVNQYQKPKVEVSADEDPLVVTSNTSLLATGESVTINWSDVASTGEYVFSYDCMDGVSLSHQTNRGESLIVCDTSYNLGDNNSLTVAIDSEKDRYADVRYELAFLTSDTDTPLSTGSGVVTVANRSVSTELAIEEESTSNELVSDSVTETNETQEPTSIDTTTENTAPVVEEYIYTVPTSDPDGTVDLSTLYIGVGEVINEQFVAKPVAIQSEGAIQFSVRNIGSKTSDDWTFSVSLPNGSVYESPEQAPLKPNERAVLTIGFLAGNETPHTFTVDTNEENDRRSNNNSFNQSVTFTQ